MIIDRLGICSVFIMYTIFASTLSWGKMAMLYGPIVTYIGLRMVISGVLFLAYFFWCRKGVVSVKRHDFFSFAQVALLGICISYVLAFWSLQHLAIAKSAFVFLLSPFFTALIGRWHGIEHMSIKKIIGLIVGALGTIPVLLSQTVDEISFSEFLFLDIPVILSIISVFCYAYGWVVFKKLIHKRYDDMFINGITMFTGGLGILSIAFFLDGWSTGISPVTAWKPYLFYLAVIIAVGSFCFSLYAAVLKKYSATLVAFFGFTEPFFAAILGLFFLGEAVSYIFLGSLIIVSAGLYLFYQEELALMKRNS